MRNIYHQILIKHKLYNHQYFQCKYSIFILLNFSSTNDTKTKKRELLTVVDTRNIRDAVASKLLAAIQQAAVRC